jgi:hypothetical protein
MFHRKAWRNDSPHRKARTRLRVEELESRITPYVTTGNAWPHPQLITISFVPDGTTIAYDQYGSPIPSTLQADFNAAFGSPAAWQKQILLAAQAWAQATNINFAVVPDSGVDLGTVTGYQQGDPTVGDIRIAGYQDFYGGELAEAYQPPPVNNYSIAGDLWFNTSQPFHIGSTYDLFTVAAHEIGHALGMDHSGNPTAIMAPNYPGTKTGLTYDDTAGIRSIYSAGAARSPDAYDAAGSNGTFATASTFRVNPGQLTAQLTNLDITTTSDVDVYKFVAPGGSSGTLNLSIQSSGLSLLEPKVWVYNGAQAQIGYKSGLGQYGTTLNLTVTGIVAGATYYIKVDGAEDNGLGTGAYALSLSLAREPVPTVALPYTQTPDGNPLHSGGGEAEGGADAYDPNPGNPGRSHDDTIDGRLPSFGKPSVGQVPFDASVLLDQDAWVMHHAHDVPAAPHAAAANHFWAGYAGQDTPGDDAFAWDKDAVPHLFGPARRGT